MANKNKLYGDETELLEKETSTKATNTAFILMFPCLILAGMAALYATSIPGSVLAIALGIYQFLMLKKFIEDYYRTR
jgi:hypothetical protein